ncbi:putative amidase family protein [Neofusicoccum parvum UCRNP2]|uniref:Putative amidase family protein n=1 Tax=Botryosphaeria parva (strain UCR-NP2) TaxID=1287680 RepID=R1ERP6_BOTPV|nr:putative amidase family protein [Neofusicoccum parvum UCRNP2]
MDGYPFDTLSATATELSRLLRSGALTSVELVDVYLAQIERHNRKGRQLRAMISVAPRYHLFAIARRLDDERRAGGIRGPLHGLPVVLKDNVATDALAAGMDTTVGSYAFVGARPRRAATVVQRLAAKGLIVLGKANLSELCGLKSPETMPGWSAVGGQTQSPYVARRLEKGVLIWDHTAPGGSSAGSAVAVAAGFAPLAVGSDTVGSLITPANRAALYALKPTVGEVPMDGVFALSRSFDAVGGMAKSAADLTFLMDALMEPVAKELESTPLRYRLFTVFRNSGPMSSFEIVAYKEFKQIIAEFFANMEESRVRSLAGLIEFNAEHPDIELPKASPDQDDLIAVLSESTPDCVVKDHLTGLRRLGGKEGIDLVLDYYGIDVLAAPGDSALCELAAAAGYPIAVVPLGALRSNGRPFGVALTARAHHEHKLLHFATAWESVFPDRAKPLPLDAVPFPKPEEMLPPDGPVIRVILKEWDTRDFRQSSDALTNWLNARWRKSGYSLSMETVYEILKTNGRRAFRGLGDEAQGAFARRKLGEEEQEGGEVRPPYVF